MRSHTLDKAIVLLTFAIVCVILMPGAVQDGMFMDGELYSAVAHNEANGYGSFWFPRFSQNGMAGLTTFHEHPPLTFGLQAIWFKLLGSGFWVERSYAVVSALITALLMMGIWRALIPADRSERALAWWPVLLWIVVPTVFWCYANNMMENTMGVFTAAAVWCAVVGAKKKWWLWHTLSGFLVFIAVMAKGIPGLYPLCAPFFLALLPWHGRWKLALGGSLWATIIVCLCFAALIMFPAAKANLYTYVESRLMHRIAVVPTVAYRWATLEMLFTNMLGPLIISAILLFLSRKERIKNEMVRYAVCIGLIGLSGVAPLMLTMVQKSFYMAAALPFVAMAIALWSAPAMTVQIEKLRTKNVATNIVGMISVVVLGATLFGGIFLFGKPSRDADLLHDVAVIGEILPKHTLVGIPPEMWDDWNMQTYFMRYHFISFGADTAQYEWRITKKGMEPKEIEKYSAFNVDTRAIDLWRRN